MTTPEDAMIAMAGSAANRLMVLAGLMRAEGLDPHRVIEAVGCVDIAVDGLKARRAQRAGRTTGEQQTEEMKR